MKNLLVKTNADTQIWISKGNQVIVFSEHDLAKIHLEANQEALKTIGNFEEVLENNLDIEIYNLDDFSFGDNNLKVIADYEF